MNALAIMRAFIGALCTILVSAGVVGALFMEFGI